MNVELRNLHRFIAKVKPKPRRCEKCHEVKKLELSCKNHIYDKDLRRWKWLCKRCHHIRDKKRVGRLKKNLRCCFCSKLVLNTGHRKMCKKCSKTYYRFRQIRSLRWIRKQLGRKS